MKFLFLDLANIHIFIPISAYDLKAASYLNKLGHFFSLFDTYLPLCILQNCNQVCLRCVRSNPSCQVGGTTNILTNGVLGSHATGQSQLRWGRVVVVVGGGAAIEAQAQLTRAFRRARVCAFLLWSACVRQFSQLSCREIILFLFWVWCFEKLDWGAVVTNVS